MLFDVYCDASKQGWGAQCGTDHAGGPWLQTEWDQADINIMELTAAKFALYSFCQPHVPEDPLAKGNRGMLQASLRIPFGEIDGHNATSD